MKKFLCLACCLFVSLAAVFGQSRDDVAVYVSPTTGGTPEEQSFFDENIKMEVMGANYLVVDDRRGADYVINLTITQEEDWDDPYAMVNILNIVLLDNSDGHEVVQFSWEYREIEEMYEWNLHLIYQAMANVPMTKLTVVPDTNHWRNKWLYVVGYGYANFQFGFFDKDRMSAEEQKNRGPYTFFLSPAIGLSLELQFLNFMSAELGFVGAQINFGSDQLSGLRFTLPLLLKFPIKPSKHFMLEPYLGIQANMSTVRLIEPTVFSWVGGFQYGVRGGERGALLIDIRVTGGLPILDPSTTQVNLGKEYIDVDSFDVYFGIGFKIGFYNRNREDPAP